MPDIVSCGAGNIVLSGRSLDLSEPRLSENCEFLSIIWNGGTGCLVNVIGLTACLDEDLTEWRFDGASGKRLLIERHAFNHQNLPNTLLFKISEQRFPTFAADRDDDAENPTSLDYNHDLTDSSGTVCRSMGLRLVLCQALESKATLMLGKLYHYPTGLAFDKVWEST